MKFARLLVYVTMNFRIGYAQTLRFLAIVRYMLGTVLYGLYIRRSTDYKVFMNTVILRYL